MEMGESGAASIRLCGAALLKRPASRVPKPTKPDGWKEDAPCEPGTDPSFGLGSQSRIAPTSTLHGDGGGIPTRKIEKF